MEVDIVGSLVGKNHALMHLCQKGERMFLVAKKMYREISCQKAAKLFLRGDFVAESIEKKLLLLA